MIKKKKVNKKSSGNTSLRKKGNDSKVNAFLTTFFSIIGFVIAILIWRDDKYVMYYAKQSLVLFIVWIVVAIVGSLFMLVPIIGWILATVIYILVLIGWILTWVYALSGEYKEVPFISNFTSKFDL